MVQASPAHTWLVLRAWPGCRASCVAGGLELRLEHLFVLCGYRAHAVHVSPGSTSSRQGAHVPHVELESVVTCPECGAGAAHQCVPVVLRVQVLSCLARAAARRLLRFLFIRYGQVPAHPARQWLLQWQWRMTNRSTGRKSRYVVFAPVISDVRCQVQI